MEFWKIMKYWEHSFNSLTDSHYNYLENVGFFGIITFNSLTDSHGGGDGDEDGDGDSTFNSLTDSHGNYRYVYDPDSKDFQFLNGFSLGKPIAGFDNFISLSIP